MNIVWFDFDGTLIHVDERFYQVHLAICSKLGISPLSKEDYWQARCNAVSTENILKLIQASELFEKYIALRNTLIESLEFLTYDVLRNGVKVTLGELKGTYTLHLLTGRSNKANLLYELENLEIKQYFSEVLMVSPFGKWEEKSTILNEYKNESYYMIGDTPNDIIAGKNAAVKTIGILGGMSTYSILSATNPDFLVNDFPEIKKIL